MGLTMSATRAPLTSLSPPATLLTLTSSWPAAYSPMQLIAPPAPVQQPGLSVQIAQSAQQRQTVDNDTQQVQQPPQPQMQQALSPSRAAKQWQPVLRRPSPMSAVPIERSKIAG